MAKGQTQTDFYVHLSVKNGKVSAVDLCDHVRDAKQRVMSGGFVLRVEPDGTAFWFVGNADLIDGRLRRKLQTMKVEGIPE